MTNGDKIAFVFRFAVVIVVKTLVIAACDKRASSAALYSRDISAQFFYRKTRTWICDSDAPISAALYTAADKIYVARKIDETAFHSVFTRDLDTQIGKVSFGNPSEVYFNERIGLFHIKLALILEKAKLVRSDVSQNRFHVLN